MLRYLTLIVFLLFGGMTVFAGIVRVPQDQPTIQAGINAAIDGDLVLVDHGTYYENLNFLGKAITVASHYYVDQEEHHIGKTIIDGSRPLNPDFGSVVNFVSGEDSNSVLCGFTITGGSGTHLLIPGFPEIRSGGGAICSASAAKICHNLFTKNRAVGAQLSYGGGITTGPPGFPAAMVIEHNTFTHNEVSGIVSADGGGITNYLPGRICNNQFYFNRVYCEQGIAGAGGFSVYSAMDPATPLTVVSGNTVSHNKTISETLTDIGAIAAGITIWGYNIQVFDNTITHNQVSSAHDYSYGAGVVLDFPDNTVLFHNNVVSHNTFSGSGGCLGGAVAIWDGHPQLHNNIISQNHASKGAGIYITIEHTVSTPAIINNTLFQNKATLAGGGIYSQFSEPLVMNSILWQNKAPEGSQIYVDGGAATVSYSDIQDGWPGTGNCDIDPGFQGPDLLLGLKSPCIDTGHPDAAFSDPEDPFSSGQALFPARGTLRNDMGAYGGPQSAAWHDYPDLSEDLQFTSASEDGELLIYNYPNPFNPSTTITFTLPRSEFVSLKIYNTLGEEVATLVSGNLSAGKHRYVWDARTLASGFYFYRLETGEGLITTRKMLLIR